MKEILLRTLGLIVMWAMIILTGLQSNTILWILLAIATFVVVYVIIRVTKVSGVIIRKFQYHKTWLMYFSIGIIVGSTYSIIRFFVLYNIGAIKVLKLFPISIDMAIIPIITLIISNIYVAFTEEMVFRAYVINALPHNLNKNIAISISAFLFLLGHAFNVNGVASASRIIELLFLGITLAIIYIRTKSLWTAIGLHFGINFFTFFLGGDGQASRQYILLSEKTPNYQHLMRWADSILPVVLFATVIVLTKIISKPSLNKTTENA